MDCVVCICMYEYFSIFFCCYGHWCSHLLQLTVTIIMMMIMIMVTMVMIVLNSYRLFFAVNVQNNYKISALLCSITLLSPTLDLLLLLTTDTSRWDSKERSTQNNNNRQLLSSLCTEKAVNENVIKASIAHKTLHNFKHVYSSTSQHAIVYTVISTNTTRYTL